VNASKRKIANLATRNETLLLLFSHESFAFFFIAVLEGSPFFFAGDVGAGIEPLGDRRRFIMVKVFVANSSF